MMTGAKDHVHVTGIDGHRTRPGANYTSDCSDCPTRFVSVPEEDNTVTRLMRTELGKRQRERESLIKTESKRLGESKRERDSRHADE